MIAVRAPSMETTIPVGPGLALSIAGDRLGMNGYPTARLQKGLLLLCDGEELGEEAVGFGVPVVMQGLRTVFPGAVELAQSRRGPVLEVTAEFEMNLVERITRPGRLALTNRWFYTAKDSLAAVIRRLPPARGLLTAISSGLRAAFGWQTTYEQTESSMTVTMTYSLGAEPGRITVAVDASSLSAAGVTEVVVMNEQGAHHFDRYWDSSGAMLRGKQIGCWDEVTAAEATFAGDRQRVAFTLGQVPGAKLFRGRELVGSRLAWAGFGYSIPPGYGAFTYDLLVERLP